uniref:Venom protein n=1 Tax=Ampulex compressa TaxID=860918 RepID=A0A1W6EW38_AMPCP|nr:venom protein [Ampulex compressa]
MKIIPQNFLLDKLIEGLNKTRANVNVAQAQGKDVEYCFETAESNQRMIKAMIVEALRMCVEYGIEHFIDKFCFAKDLFKDGEIIIQQLGDIVISCSSNPLTSCYNSEMAKVNVDINNYHEKYNQRQIERQTSYKSALDYSLVCFNKRINDTMSEIAKEFAVTNTCIQGAKYRS